MEVSLLPKLKAGSSKEEFNEWLAEFSAFTDLVLKEEEKDTKGIKFIKYAIAASKVIVAFDGNTTFASGLEKIKRQFNTQNKSKTPLKDFYECKWINTSLTFAQYVLKIESFAEFINNKSARDELILQHCLEQLKAEFRILLKGKNLQQLIETVSELSKDNVCEGSFQPIYASQQARDCKVQCFNCSKMGHYSTQCRQKKVKCSCCGNMGHHINFCRNRSKNVHGVSLSVDQVTPTNVQSTH